MRVNRWQMSDPFTREKKCFGHYFQRGFWQARSLELQRRERWMPAVRCLRKDSRALMRVHRDTAWAPDNSVS
jgi:hypothetical protein